MPKLSTVHDANKRPLPSADMRASCADAYASYPDACTSCADGCCAHGANEMTLPSSDPYVPCTDACVSCAGTDVAGDKPAGESQAKNLRLTIAEVNAITRAREAAQAEARQKAGTSSGTHNPQVDEPRSRDGRGTKGKDAPPPRKVNPKKP